MSYQDTSYLDIKELSGQQKSYTLYPSPANQIIRLSDQQINGTIVITSLEGKEIFSSQTLGLETTDMSEWPKGIYLQNKGQRRNTFM